jgi:hypothetical protein
MKVFNYPVCFSASLLFLLSSGCGPNTPKAKAPDTRVEIDSEKAAGAGPEATRPDTTKKSIPAEASGKIGKAAIRIIYSSPAVRGRVIWGKLVPYNKIWVTGAHNASSLETDRDLMIGGTRIPAGKYAIFTIPGENEWTVIINKRWRQHQADKYSEEEDLLRLKVRPQTGQNNQERLKYEIVSEGRNTGKIVVSWEKIRLAVPVKGM